MHNSQWCNSQSKRTWKKSITSPAQVKAFSHLHLTSSPHWVMAAARATLFNQKLPHSGCACSTRAQAAQSPAGWLGWFWKAQVSWVTCCGSWSCPCTAHSNDPSAWLVFLQNVCCCFYTASSLLFSPSAALCTANNFILLTALRYALGHCHAVHSLFLWAVLILFLWQYSGAHDSLLR